MIDELLLKTIAEAFRDDGLAVPLRRRRVRPAAIADGDEAAAANFSDSEPPAWPHATPERRGLLRRA